MAVTLTFGAGGTYANPVLARDAIPALMTDNYILSQVGAVATYSNVFFVSHSGLDQAGYSITVQGNGDPIDCTVDFIYIYLNTTGSVYFQGLTVECDTFISVRDSNTNNNNYEFHARRNLVTHINPEFVEFPSSDKETGFGKFFVYQNYTKGTASTLSWLLLYSFSGDLNQQLYFEDNFIEHTGVSTMKLVSGLGTDYQSGAQTIHFRRNYVKIAGATVQNDYVYLADISNFVTDTYTNVPCTDISATHDEIPFDANNFRSVDALSEVYGIPKPGSPVYDDATQVTDIPDNIADIKGRAVDYKAAGCYAPIEVIEPPTGLAYTPEATGIRLSWTPYAPAQSGYEDVSVFWELIPDESEFTAPKANVLKSTNSYLIPFSELDASPVWYARVSHDAE